MRLFAYGTLMLPEVMEIVAGRRYALRAAELCGWGRRLLVGAVYPAVVPAPGETTAGVLFEGLDAATLGRLDRFEGEPYERRLLRVSLEHGAEREAFVYVLRPDRYALASNAPWDEAAFRAYHLADYLAGCRAFAREQP
jgi:gamma-glutamylcyclotransferase (GGCT)/AIG2-like uncharacterized protein YtfP